MKRRASLALRLRPVTALAALATPLLAVALAGVGTSGCKCGSEPTPASASANHGVPSLRLYVMSSVAGALEPCGCVKDMLGGADHAAAYIASQSAAVPHALTVGAGPMLFLNARPDAAHGKAPTS